MALILSSKSNMAKVLFLLRSILLLAEILLFTYKFRHISVCKQKAVADLCNKPQFDQIALFWINGRALSAWVAVQ